MEARVFGHTIITVFVSSGISFVLVIIHEAVRHYSGSPIMAIDWAANALMVATSFYVRSHVDKDRYRQAIMSTLPGNKQVSPIRFINGIPAALAVSLAAEITLRYNFIAGMLLYLAMQVLLIYSFSGIISLEFRDFISRESRVFYITIVAVCLLVPAAAFYLIIHNGVKSLVVVPYMLFLCIMTMMTFFACVLTARPLLFRLAPVAASTLFVISDIMVGYVAFNDPLNKCYAAISMTYITALLLFNMSIMFLKTGKGEYVLS